MSLCLQISCSVGLPDGFLRNYVAKHAQKFEIEGVAQFIAEGKLRVVACGQKDAVDDFVDSIHQAAEKYKLEEIELEPFVRVKDYRGVFRILE